MAAVVSVVGGGGGGTLTHRRLSNASSGDDEGAAAGHDSQAVAGVDGSDDGTASTSITPPPNDVPQTPLPKLQVFVLLCISVSERWLVGRDAHCTAKLKP